VFWTKRIWSVKYLFFLKKVEENYFKGSRQSLVRLSKRCKCSMRKTKQTDRSKERQFNEENKTNRQKQRETRLSMAWRRKESKSLMVEE
jgi:hypothetical protein